MAFINWDEYIEKTKPLKEDWFEPEEVGEECFPEVSTFKITNSTIECVMIFDDYGDDLLCVKVIVPYQRQDGKVVIDASNASGVFVDSENHNLYIMADDIAADFDLNDTEAIISEAINNFILTYNNPEVGDSFADKFGCEVLVESCDKTGLTEGQYGLFQDRFPRVPQSERPKYRKNTKHIWLVIEYDDKTFDLITDYQIANAIKNLFKNPRQSIAASVERIIVPHGDVDMVVYQKNPIVTTQSKVTSNSDSAYTYNETPTESLTESIPTEFGTLDLIDLQRNQKDEYDSVKNSEEMKNIIDDFLDAIGNYSQTKEYDKFGLSKLTADLTTVSKDLQKVIDDIADKYKK